MVSLNEISDNIIMGILNYSPKLFMAIIVLIFGLWFIGIIHRLFTKLLEKKKVEISLRHFLASFASVSLKILLIVTVIGILGVATTSLVAVLAAAGFAVGLALQGSLSNFAGGVLILLFKPFKVGDFIEAQGFMGSVNKIDLLVTILKTPDNKTIIIPNGPLSNGSVINFSSENTRRVDMIFGVSYNENLDKVQKILEELISSDERVLKDPSFKIIISKLNSSSIDFTIRAWVNSSDYWNLFFDMQKKVKEEFDKHNISIPFPQQDVHIYKH